MYSPPMMVPTVAGLPRTPPIVALPPELTVRALTVRNLSTVTSPSADVIELAVIVEAVMSLPTTAMPSAAARLVSLRALTVRRISCFLDSSSLPSMVFAVTSRRPSSAIRLEPTIQLPVRVRFVAALIVEPSISSLTPAAPPMSTAPSFAQMVLSMMFARGCVSPTLMSPVSLMKLLAARSVASTVMSPVAVKSLPSISLPAVSAMVASPRALEPWIEPSLAQNLMSLLAFTSVPEMSTSAIRVALSSESTLTLVMWRPALRVTGLPSMFELAMSPLMAIKVATPLAWTVTPPMLMSAVIMVSSVLV
ncbi:MAG: hypothetical protein BWX54_02041 [Verrucomicrobia bacterium ADurb.Bin018]|nr:MAG: hypothetical protein BWX54_02041 [Verrucomicrobia bacterium ADurb.Bin018]